jgi:hypothetical protein
MRTWRAIIWLGAVFVLAACAGSGTTEPKLIGEGRRVLFVGNSYLYTLDVPGLVQALADSAGEKIAIMSVVGPDMALIDHVAVGVAITQIRKGGWEWVVLQQGPSAAELNRDTLRLATKILADEMAKVGAMPALFSAWPQQHRRVDFPRAIESYQLAAQDVSGIFLPVAYAWLTAWESDAAIELYADGLHPSAAGAYLAALVIYGRLLNKTPIGLPARVQLRSGGVLSVPPAVATMLQQSAAAALADP